jgi:germacradienol/geosmin synthase
MTMKLARVTLRPESELFETRPMIQLKNAAQDYACLLNDIFSYQKEIQFEDELHNCVLVVERFLGITPAQAVAVVNDLMTSRMRQFEHIVADDLPIVAADLGLDHEQRAKLDARVVSRQDWMAGILDWHRLTGRYDEAELRRLKTPGAILPARRLATLLAGPSGLGAAAAQLAPPASEGVVGAVDRAFVDCRRSSRTSSADPSRYLFSTIAIHSFGGRQLG